jgi:hypothetical protein
MGHLEQVETGDPGADEERIDLLFGIAGQQEATPARVAEQHDRDVVDPRARIGRLGGHAPGRRPQDAQVDLVDPQPVAGREPFDRRGSGSGKAGNERGIPGSRPAHPGLEQPTDLVAPEQERDAGHVILVRVRQDDQIEPSVPRWKERIEGLREPIRVRPAVDEQAAAAAALDEDRVALPDVEDRHPYGAARPAGHSDRRDRDRHDGDRRDESHRPPGGPRDCASGDGPGGDGLGRVGVGPPRRPVPRGLRTEDDGQQHERGRGTDER